jgi:MinD-like ATPase involved in chromosome partitioning or flagellar assembly
VDTVYTREVLGFSTNNKGRIIEAYIGEYASGKSEMAINRALDLKNQGRQVTLVDLDTVEPFYTLRSLKRILEEMGMRVISFAREDSFGLGETGAMLNPQARWALMNEGDIIMDIGYGVQGAKTLNLVEGANESSDLVIIAVINGTRPMTDSQLGIKEYLTELGRVDAIVLNTHLGNETTVDIIKKGNDLIQEVAREMSIPIVYMAVNEDLQELMPATEYTVPVKYIKRYMPGAIW